MLVALLLGWDRDCMLHFRRLIGARLPTIVPLVGHSLSELSGLFALAGVDLCARLTLFSYRKFLLAGSQFVDVGPRRATRLGILGRTVLLTNAFLALLAYGDFKIVRLAELDQTPAHAWGASLVLEELILALLWFIVMSSFVATRERFWRNFPKPPGANPATHFTRIIRPSFALSMAFRTYVIVAYGFLQACLYEVVVIGILIKFACSNDHIILETGQ
jgi:hypothetical protein